MKKTVTVETVSYKTRRVKVGPDTWVNIDPFIDLNTIKFGQQYEIDLKLDNQSWFIESIKPVEVVK